MCHQQRETHKNNNTIIIITTQSKSGTVCKYSSFQRSLRKSFLSPTEFLFNVKRYAKDLNVILSSLPVVFNNCKIACKFRVWEYVKVDYFNYNFEVTDNSPQGSLFSLSSKHKFQGFCLVPACLSEAEMDTFLFQVWSNKKYASRPGTLILTGMLNLILTIFLTDWV